MESYVEERPESLRFFSDSWRNIEGYRKRAGELGTRFDTNLLREAAGAIQASTPEAQARLDALVREGGCFVTTGQQPGLFTGPLYSIYKALTAVKLAAELESILEHPVLPLFWIASEDHDWAEVNHTYVLDAENELRRLEAHADLEGRTPPVHRIALDGTGHAATGVEEGAGDGSLDGVIAELSALLPDTDFKTECLAMLRRAYVPGASLSTGFFEIMKELFAPWGLLFVDATDPVLKKLSVPVLVAELDAAHEHEELLAGEAAKLTDAGFHVQVPILSEGINLFLEDEGGRERIYRSGDGFRLRHSGRELTRAELDAIFQKDPSRISPNVLLRPVVENSVFPVVSVVAGPGELGYYAQLARFFEAHGLRMPIVHPRLGATVVETKIGKVLDKFGLEADVLARPHHEVASRLLREEIPPDVRRAIGELRGTMSAGLGRLLEAGRKIDPTLKGPIEHARSVSQSALDDVEKKIMQSLKRENEIALSQIEKAQMHLYPLGKPQERVLNVFYYLARYGQDFIPGLAERFEIGLEAEAREGV